MNQKVIQITLLVLLGSTMCVTNAREPARGRANTDESGQSPGRVISKATNQQATCVANVMAGGLPCEIFAEGFEALDSCTILKGSIVDPIEQALFQPYGYAAEFASWNTAFNGNDYPDSWGAHYPIGSWTLGNSVMLGKYLVIPFRADTVSQHKIEWIPAVAIAQLFGYAPRPATGVLVTISPCAGDFRTSTAYTGPASDPTLRVACRKFDDTGSIYFGQRVNLSVCPVVSGRIYYLNIIFADPRDGLLSPAESTCDTNHPNYFPSVCDGEFYMRQ